MSETALDKKQVIAELVKSPHKDLTTYLPVGRVAAAQDPDFFAHLIGWNHHKGQVRDAKVALPMIALAALNRPANLLTDDRMQPYADHALALLADLRPREFKRAIEFGWDIGAPTRLLKRLVIRYLRDLEADKHEWERTAVQHRKTLRWLYAQSQIPVRAPMGEAVLFGQHRKGRDRGPAPARFQALASLATLSPVEIAGVLERYKFPFLIARGALGIKAKEPDVVQALMARMSNTELVTNMKWLERVGVKTVPALRAALAEALGKAAESKKAPKATLKATRAADALADEPVLSGKLRVLQEKQLDHLRGVEGNWAVLADKSGSMEQAMEMARMVAGTLARMVKGSVHLIFFDTDPRYLDVTGKTYEDIQALTKGFTALGGTLIGCGMQYLAERGIKVEGIAIVSDGCENEPMYGTSQGHFGPAFAAYTRRVGLTDTPPTVYWYRTPVSVSRAVVHRVMRDHAWSEARAIDGIRQQAADEVRGFQARCRANGIEVQTFDLSASTDFYSVVNLVPTMRVARYALLDEIHGTPLRELDDVLDKTQGMPVLPQRQPVMV